MEFSHHKFVAGVDEVGRGALAGPVVAGVVILNPEKVVKYQDKTKVWSGIRDSKTLSSRQRDFLAGFIQENALDFAFGYASHQEIDEINILQASLLAMRRSIERLTVVPELILLDGLYAIPSLEIKQQAIINGDAKILAIAAASILAKVHRDSLMKTYSKYFPKYGFEKHKGYDTDFHRKKLFIHGPSEIHRMTFSTVSDAMNSRWKDLL